MMLLMMLKGRQGGRKEHKMMDTDTATLSTPSAPHSTLYWVTLMDGRQMTPVGLFTLH